MGVSIEGGGGSNLLHTITFDDVSCWLWDYSNTSFFFTFFVSFQSALAESFKFVLGWMHYNFKLYLSRSFHIIFDIVIAFTVSMVSFDLSHSPWSESININLTTAWKVSNYWVFSGPYLVRMRENTYQKELRIWTLFMQWTFFVTLMKVSLTPPYFS